MTRKSVATDVPVRRAPTGRLERGSHLKIEMKLIRSSDRCAAADGWESALGAPGRYNEDAPPDRPYGAGHLPLH